MTTLEIVIYIFFVLIIGLIGFMYFKIKTTFKHKVRMTDLGKQGIELDFTARDYIENGVRYWRLSKEKTDELKNIPLPPARAINITNKGKKSIECIRTETGEIIFLDKTINIPDYDLLKEELENIPSEIINIQDKAQRDEAIALHKKIVLKKMKENVDGMMLQMHEPFTSKQRMVLMNNFTKANARKGFSWREQIVPIVALGSLVLIVIALMVFWGDIAKPALDARQIGVAEQKIQLEIVQTLQDIKNGQQRILEQTAGG